MKRYAFYFDSSSCSGCKACQVACKDKNGLPEGVLWRRVYEVTGGGWRQAGPAWVADVFAYNLSISCNHCEKPLCLQVCPARAYTQRSDGIVLLDSEKCMGCGYCAWACPYGAPQMDERAGRMTKCNFCVDQVDAGRPPECVLACPLRALDFGDRRELEARYASRLACGGLPAAAPLPDPLITRPSLLLTPHPAAQSSGSVANREEV